MADARLSQLTFRIFKIVTPNWNQVESKHQNLILREITAGGWQQSNNTRRGFLQCATLKNENVVYGYYAMEGNVQVEQYDEKQEPIPESRQKTFEKIVFMIFLGPGIIVLQSTRIPRSIDLTWPTLRNAMLGSLEGIFRNAGLAFRGKVTIEQYTQTYTKDELLEVFKVNNVTRIKVADLYARDIPETLRFFNPDFDADAFLRAVIESDLKHSQEVNWKGDNLQNVKIAKGLMHAGEPKVVEAITPSGEKRVWENTEVETFEIELNTSPARLPEEDAKKLLNRIRQMFGDFRSIVKGAVKDAGGAEDLPLFKHSQD